MASGKQHAIATSIAAGVIGPLLVFGAGQSLDKALFCMLGCIIGLVITPDLEVRHRPIHSQGIVRRTAGHRVAVIWFLLWLPYAYLIPYHRHWISHLPILGTTIRLVYLLVIPALLWYGLSCIFPLPALGVPPINSLLWWLFGGLAFVDIVHFIMDQI